jgi:predicted outer membrane repeat protein
MFAKKAISCIFSGLLVIVIILSVTPLREVHAAGMRYAKPAASGTGDCLSWENACTLQTALTGATSGDEIWAAAGMHKPTTGTNRYATFQLKDGVAIYGGFAGTETGRDQRNPAGNLTILSGDVDNNDSQTPIITDLNTVTGNNTNSHHVVTGATGATLDGFTITAGYEYFSGPTYIGGGGMYNIASSPTVVNVSFIGNYGSNFGGAMYNASGSNPALTNVTFSGNTGRQQGGGIYNSSSSPTLTNVVFNGNWAYSGGGMWNNSSNPILTNVTFNSNSAQFSSGGTGYYGGGMGNVNSSPTLTNVTFSGNTANTYGGGMSNDSSIPTLTNVTFSGNTANSGGGMYNNSSSPTLTNVTFNGNSAPSGGGIYNISGSNPTIRNTILWGNTVSYGTEIFNSSSTPVLSDSVVQGGCPAGSTCTNIITGDPRLGPLYGYGGFNQTIPILAGSSAIDTGNDSICPATDQRGLARPQGAHCDIGAVEYDFVVFNIFYVKPAISGTGNCQSWSSACPLHIAFGLLNSPDDEIWVAAGTYKPTTNPTHRDATFQLKEGVAVYGGFAGTETGRDQRNPAANLTVLSGDIDNNDSQTPVITDPATVGGNGTNSLHVVTAASGATLDGFTITAGYGISAYANLAKDGSGMYNVSSSNLTLANITFSGNMAMNGGGMYNSSSSPTLTNVIFSNNQADTSGSGMYGGGMYNVFSSNPILTNVTFSNNMAWRGGGMANGASNPTLTNVAFNNNAAWHGFLTDPKGGGMYNSGSSPTLTDVTFDGNSAKFGGGMYNYSSSSPDLTDVTFSGNSATSTGGGMVNDTSSNPTILDVTFNGNTATQFGGGMSNNNSSPLILNTTFSGNSSPHGGGMVNNTNSAPTIVNSTFSVNTAANDGGGIFNTSNGNPTLINTTFSGNSAGYGGGMNSLSSHPRVFNTIFWNNTATSAGAQIYNVSSTAVISTSVVQAGCPAGSTCTNLITTNPNLGTLGDNGGATQTIPLQPGSSAIDAGIDATCPTIDQRGVARPQGDHCDIGAFEMIIADITSPTVTSITRLDPSPTNLPSVRFRVTFSEAVTGVNGSDFSIQTVGVSGSSVTGVSGSGSVYTVTVSTGSGSGTLRLDVTDNDSIVDTAGNPLGGTGAGNGNFTGGEIYGVRLPRIYLPLVQRN